MATSVQKWQRRAFLGLGQAPIPPGVTTVTRDIPVACLLDFLRINRSPPGLMVLGIRHNVHPVRFALSAGGSYYVERRELAVCDLLAVDVFNWTSAPLVGRMGALVFVPHDPTAEEWRADVR